MFGIGLCVYVLFALCVMWWLDCWFGWFAGFGFCDLFVVVLIDYLVLLVVLWFTCGCVINSVGYLRCILWFICLLFDCWFGGLIVLLWLCLVFVSFGC